MVKLDGPLVERAAVRVITEAKSPIINIISD
jgi:LacI family transcriptional regulator